MCKIKIVAFDEPYKSAIEHIRKTVFIKEQGVNPLADFEGKDPHALHALCICNGEYIGTGRILKDGHIGRIAILKEFRNQGFGKEIVIALTEKAKQLGLKRVFLGAQEHAIHFYEKLGFVAYGELFIEENIMHKHMEIIFDTKTDACL